MTAADIRLAPGAGTNGNTGLTRPQTQTQAPPVSRYQGEEAEDAMLPRVHLFQGLPKETEIYGKGPASGGTWAVGDLIDALGLERIASNKFVPIIGFSEYIRFGKDRQGRQTSEIVYRTRNKHEVPIGDLVWKGEGETREPPACTKFMNWVVLFEGVPTPLVLSFKTTSLNAGKSIVSFEKFRGRRGPGFYEFTTREKSNTRGKWLTPSIRPIGDPPEKMRDDATAMFNNMVGTNLQIAEDAGMTVDEDGDIGGAGSGEAADGGGDFNPDNL